MSATAELEIVSRREVLSDPPKLVDYHLAPEVETEELPEAYGYESIWETSENDLGGFRAARARARGERPARSAARGSR